MVDSLVGMVARYSRWLWICSEPHVFFAVAAFLIGWMFFRVHHPSPVNVNDHPSFNAALYTLDLLVPVPGLGQVNDWNPHGIWLVLAVGLRCLGWLLAITLVAAITRTLSRN